MSHISLNVQLLTEMSRSLLFSDCPDYEHATCAWNDHLSGGTLDVYLAARSNKLDQRNVIMSGRIDVHFY